MKRLAPWILLTFVLATTGSAQQPNDWPGPNEYRQSDGAPGPAYWQQRADYTIAATLDTGAKRVTGTVTVRYTNNSPDTLRFVWMQLDQNLFQKGSEGSF